MREEYARAARCFETGARGFLAYTQELNKKDNLDIHGLQDVIALAETRGEFYFLSELHRMKAELFLIDEKQSEAEASFQKALQIARQQNAKSWELRAAIGLSKLWADQGKTGQAKEILLPLYRWFTEGFETKEYIQAKQLLEQIETHSAD
jgi:predicted ATPase